MIRRHGSATRAAFYFGSGIMNKSEFQERSTGNDSSNNLQCLGDTGACNENSEKKRGPSRMIRTRINKHIVNQSRLFNIFRIIFGFVKNDWSHYYEKENTKPCVIQVSQKEQERRQSDIVSTENGSIQAQRSRYDRHHAADVCKKPKQIMKAPIKKHKPINRPHAEVDRFIFFSI
jgi:hypothetical protein